MPSYRPELIDRERKILELRRAGMSFMQIADELGYRSSSSVGVAFKRALRRTLVEAGAEELRDVELDRLDRLQQAVWDRAMDADLPAVSTVLRIMEQRAKMLGLFAPEKHQVEVGPLDASTIDAEVARLAAMLTGNRAQPVIDAEVIDDEVS